MDSVNDSIVCFHIAVLVLIISATRSADASIHFYGGDHFREVGNALLVSGGSEGILASRTTTRSLHFSAANGRSYIRFDNITFWRTKAAKMGHSSGLIQVIIFEAADRDNIGGSPYGGQRSICCTPDLAKLEGCKQGQVIGTPSTNNPNWPIILNVRFNGNHLSTHLKNTNIYIKKTGMYNLFFISCDIELKGLTIGGRTFWKNPDGYLPGRMAPLMKFYLIMSLTYTLLSLIWLSQNVRFWKDVLQLQHCITAVIALGLFEMLLWYFEYLHFNNYGTRPVGITTWVVTVGAIRRTLARLLILCVSMGFGVVRPTLGGLTTKVMLVGVTYFFATELLNITEYVGTINDIAGRARVILVFPVACLDAFLILWIFTSLSKTLEQLQAKRSSVKLDIYRKFSNALAVTVIASVAWIGYEVYFKVTDPFNEKWQGAWIITAFWDILALALLCVICYLWAPSQSSQRYAYSEEKGEDSEGEGEGEDDELLGSNTPIGDIALVINHRKETNVEGTKSFDLEEEEDDFDAEEHKN